MGRRIVSFELTADDQDIAQAFAELPGHVTKSGLIRLALRSYLGAEQVSTLDFGEAKVVRQELSDDALEDNLDAALGGF